MALRDTLLLGSDAIVPRHFRAAHEADLLGSATDDVPRLVNRILDELVQPLQDIQLDNSEFSFLKAIVFFDPGEPRTGLVVHSNMSLSSFVFVS